MNGVASSHVNAARETPDQTFYPEQQPLGNRKKNPNSIPHILEEQPAQCRPLVLSNGTFPDVALKNTSQLGNAPGR